MGLRRWVLYLWSEGSVQVARYDSLRALLADQPADSTIGNMIEESIWHGTHLLVGQTGECRGMTIGRLERGDLALPPPMGWVEFRFSCPWGSAVFETTLEDWKRRLREEGNGDWRWNDSPTHYAYRHDGVHAMAWIPADGTTLWYIDGVWMTDEEAEAQAPGKRAVAHYRLVRGGAE